jgi:DNA repair protein SbcD/Mre11
MIDSKDGASLIIAGKATEVITMTPLKLLHTADIHLGMTFKNRDYPEDVRRLLVEARFESLEKLVALAEENKCRLIIVAGDLFHRVSVPAAQVGRAVNILKRFSGVTALLPGNHDYYEPSGPLWSKLKELASEELVLLTEQKPYDLSDYGLDVVLCPAPCDGKHSTENRLGWLSGLTERPAGKWQIGIAHGTVKGVSPDFNDQYYPMEEAELASLGLDHWCLGHTHVPYPAVSETGKQPFIFSGVPEPDGFDCRHGGSAWLTEFEQGGNTFSRQLSTGQFRFAELEKTVGDSADLKALTKEIARKGEKTLVKLKLTGTLPEADYNGRGQTLNSLEEKVLYLETDESELTLEINASVIDSKYPQGSFPHRLLKRLSAMGEPDAVQAAYRLVEEVKK